MMENEENQKIITSSKRAYSALQTVFCCKCFDCCKQQNIITSNVRKQTLQRMIRNYVINEDEIILYDPIKLMILIYLCQDISIPQRHLQKCRVNPNLGTQTYRTDLEFYTPQLCNYLVFHNDLNGSFILDGMERGSKLNFYFGHLYYFYMLSIEKTINKNQIQVFKKVAEYRHSFLNQMCKYYEGQHLSGIELYGGFKTNVYPIEPELGYIIKSYGTKDEEALSLQKTVNAEDITLPKYTSIYNNDAEIFSFKSTLNFFEDLFVISEQLKSSDNRKQDLRKNLMIINERLPACVYIPFSKNFMRLSNVLNIVAKESKIFSTKQRAPIYICVEVYNPCQGLQKQNEDKFWEQVQTPFTLAQSFKSQSIFSNRRKTIQLHRNNSNMSFNNRRNPKYIARSLEDPFSDSIQTEVLSERNSKFLTNKLLQFSNQQETQPRLPRVQQNTNRIQMKTIYSETKKVKQALKNVFGESQNDMKERIRGKSIYGGFQSWDLVHLIVKTFDNLKQEQFALQLIYEFDYIFKLQKLPLNLTPYQVLSMGPDCGIIEMVKDSITFDGLKKKLKTQFPKPLSLKEFFQSYFVNNLAQAKQTFMKSLAAYSLVMYFLQAKDRHNGNILLHKSGKIFHIDFGFFLSNLPGKGVQLQKSCPFKLMSEHIQVLDGPQSYYFKKFRQYLFLGFKAARKHQNKILILVKMMYSSSGTTMPCFEKGEQGILQMQQRFNPPNVFNDAQLNLYCQKLIDDSLDNWAARWYDRWQYWAQGIFY